MTPATSSRPGPRERRPIGRIVAGSLVTGLVVGLLLVVAPFVPAEDSRATGALLCGFALGWAMLAVLSVRFSDQPQRWAAAPAVFMGLSGLLLLVFGSSVHAVLRWLWPPALLALVVWMIVWSRRELRSRSRQWLLYPVFATLVLAAVGGGYETVAEAVEANAFTMPGELIDVGGHRLHLSCTGSGSPTVVLEPGAGEMSSALGWVAPAVASRTRVCVYDRAGRGWSDPADTTQDATQIATDLRALLERGNVPGPFVLAGHSFGGLYVLTFAALYPDDVAGMVLVDSTAPAAVAKPGVASSGDGGSYSLLGRISALASSSARLGVGRLIGRLDYGDLPPRSRDEMRAGVATARYMQSTIDEYVQATASAEEAATLVDLGDKPLVVLTAGVGSAAAWLTAQDHLATLSLDSVHRVIEGANHMALIHDEQGAAATTQAIVDVVSAIRNDEPLGR